MKTKSALSSLAIAAIAAQGIFAGAAFAEPRHDKPAHKMELSDFDANDDGDVTVEEFDAFWAEKAAEWKEKREDRKERRADRAEETTSSTDDAEDDAARPMPRQHEGMRDRMKDMKMPTGADIDTDGDGIITQDEVDAAKEAAKARWDEMRAEKHHGGSAPETMDDHHESDEDEMDTDTPSDT